MIRFQRVFAVDGSGAAKSADRKRPVYCLSPSDGAITWCETPSGLLSFMRERVFGAKGGPVLLTVDVPIGLPEGFAEVYAGHASFVDWLLAAQRGRADLIADDVASQCAAKPFVEVKKNDKKKDGRFPLRRCDELAPGAASVYWCVGGKQVGKAALQFWLDVLVPLLIEHRSDMAVWPFEEVSRAKLVIAECYPGLVSKGVWGRKVIKSSPCDVAEAIADNNDARDGTDERTRLHASSSEDDFDGFTICLAIRRALKEGRDLLAAPETARPYEGSILLLTDVPLTT